jgi:hypothetical protein
MITEPKNNAFDLALQKQEQEEKQKEAKKKKTSVGADYEQLEWEGLVDGKDVVFRIIGNPISLRENTYDPERVFFSKIVRDDGKGYCHIIWKKDENGELDNEWIFKRLYDKVMESKWVKYADGVKNEKGYNGEYRKLFEDTPSYKRIDTNSKKDDKYPPRFYPAQRVLMNIISRMDDWCKENKHTKLLSSKSVPFKPKDGEVFYFTDFGFPNQVYENILKNVIQFRKNWNLDVVVQKDAGNKSYIVRDIQEDKILESTKALGNNAPLTEEECQYECYNIDKISKHASYTKLKKQLVGLFKQASIDTGYPFDEELNALADAEQQEREEATEDVAPDATEESNVSAPVAKAPESVEQAPRKRTAPEEKSVPVEQTKDFSKIFPTLSKLQIKQQHIIQDSVASINEGVPIWNDPKDALPCGNTSCTFPGTSVKTTFPSTVFTCPVCGNIEEAE